MQDWLSLWGKAGVTNYIHMLISGHITEYMIKFRSLYRFSQQGWENLNHILKSFFFKRTNHGGTKYRSKLNAIGRWQQCRVVFMCGFSESDILNYNTNQI